MDNSRILKVQEYLKNNKIDAYLALISDDHGSEYIAKHYKSISFLSGFTGSNGYLLIMQDKAYLWTDGRYFLQASKQLEASKTILMKMGIDEALDSFIANNVKSLAFDFKEASNALVASFKKASNNLKLIDEDALIDNIWKNRPALPKDKVFLLDAKSCLHNANYKLHQTILKTSKENNFGVLISDLTSIAYELNLRGNDIAFTPVFMAYLFLEKENKKEKYTLYIQNNKLTSEVKAYLKENKINTKPYLAIYKDVLNYQNKIYFEGSKTNYKLCTCIAKKNDITLYPTLAKSIKNHLEIKDTTKAHIKDGVAMCKFLYFVKSNVGKIKMDEIGLASYLETLRRSQGAFELSFETICGYQANGAIIHYTANKKTNAKIYDNGFLLVDSGGQYYDGTTDITRTLAFANLTSKMKFHYTLVLKSHIALASATFAKGFTDGELDTITRKVLIENGLDFNHGTGHGVGHILSVHEGPQRIGKKTTNLVAMQPGMITSDEPGLYFENEYGIRLENEILCVKLDKNTLGFKTLTMVPFDLDAIDISMLDEKEKEWLNNYHAEVYKNISKYLTKKEKEFLAYATRSI